jgi:hypothetical protein
MAHLLGIGIVEQFERLPPVSNWPISKPQFPEPQRVSCGSMVIVQIGQICANSRILMLQ